MKIFLISFLLFATPLAHGLEIKDISFERHDEYFEKGSSLIKPFMQLHGKDVKQADKELIGEGISYLNAVTQINNRNWAAYWIKGKAFQALGDSNNAYLEFKKSFSIEKENPNVARELMIECLRLGKASEGVEVALHAQGISPTDSGLNANVGLAYLIKGDLDNAIKYTKEAIRLDESDKINRNLLRMIENVKSGKRPQPMKYDDLFR